jgi:TPR repeat protein
MKIKILSALIFLIVLTASSYGNEYLAEHQSSVSISYCQLEICKLHFNKFKKAAKSGNPGIMATLGQFYSIGYGVEPNELEAINFLRKASNYADAIAQYKLGLIYLTSKENHDLDTAIKYLNKAARKGHKNANLLLGSIYYNNQFIPQNSSLADEYLSKSYQQQNHQMSAAIGSIKKSIPINNSPPPLLSQKIDKASLAESTNDNSQLAADEIKATTPPPLTQFFGYKLGRVSRSNHHNRF